MARETFSRMICSWNMTREHPMPKHSRISWSWRVTVSVGLVVAYLVLAGDAIRCQYFTSEHDHHRSSSSQNQTHHATHCLIANHGATAIPAVASLGADPLPPLGHTSPIDVLPVKAADVGSQSARAPPAV